MAVPVPQVHINVQALATALADLARALTGTAQCWSGACLPAQLTLAAVEHGLPLNAVYDMCLAVTPLGPTHVSASQLSPRNLSTF